MAKKPTKPTKTIEDWGDALQELLEAKDFEELLNQALLCREEHKDKYQGPSYMALALHNLEKYEDAIHFHDIAIGLNSSSAVLYDYRGISKSCLYKHEEAIEDYSKAIALNTEYADAYNNRGGAQLSLNRLGAALNDFNKAIELNPDHTTAYFNRSHVKVQLNTLGEALEDYDKAINLKPDYASAYNNRGNTKVELGRHEEAIKDYDKAIELEPDNASAYNNRGNAKDDLGHYEEAIKDFDKAIELEPDYASAYNNRGAPYDALERYDEALKDFSTAIKIAPENDTAYFNRGNILVKLSRYDDAISDYDQAIELNPQDLKTYHNKAIAIGLRGAEKTEKELKRNYEKRLKEYIDPENITAFYEEEISRSRFRLYGSLEDLKNPELEHGISLLHIAKWGLWFIRYRFHYPYLITFLCWFLALFFFFCLDIVGQSQNLKELLCYIALFFVIPIISSASLIKGLWQRNQNKLRAEIEIPDAPFIGRINTGYQSAAERASSRYRFIVPVMWLGVAYLFYRFYFNGLSGTLADIKWLEVIAYTTTLLIVTAPFTFHVRYLASQKEQELVRLHALIRDRQITLFWQAQVIKSAGSNETQLAEQYLNHMHTNSSADMSFKMIRKPLFSRKHDERIAEHKL